MAGSLEFIKSTSGTNVASIDVTDCFSDKYDVYKITLTKWHNPSGDSNALLRLIDSGGSVISDNEYDNAQLALRSYNTYPQDQATNTSNMGTMAYTPLNQTYNVGAVIYIFNPYDNSSFTFLKVQNANRHSSGLLAFKGIAVHKVAEQITGFNLYSSQSATQDVEAKVYGVK